MIVAPRRLQLKRFALGLGSEHLGVAVHGDEAVVFEHDEDTEIARDTAAGAVVGVPIGAIAGIALAALVVPGPE